MKNIYRKKIKKGIRNTITNQPAATDQPTNLCGGGKDTGVSVVNICGLQVGDHISISFLGRPKLKLEVVGVSRQEPEVMEEEEVVVAVVVVVVVVVVEVERAMVEGGRAILGRLTSPRLEGCQT